LVEEIGRGGMGVVYRARDLALTREVAVKLLLDGYEPDSAVARRFMEEAQITGQLQHPGIPAVHQTGTTPQGSPFLAMKLVKGRTLAQILGDRPDPFVDRSRFLAIFEHICHAVGYAHAHDVIHRDLKPANIMVGAFGEVQVMDWGLAKLVKKEIAPGTRAPAEADLEPTRTEIGPRRSPDLATQAGSLLGTPAYMSPEQAGGETDQVGPRSDVFGLGAILCVILTGHPPYRGPGTEAVRLQAVRGQRVDAFARLDACGAEPELVALAKRCLADLPERPADAGEVADAVARLRAAAEERARQAELERAAAEVRAAEQRKRRRVWYGLAATMLLGAVASVVFAVLAHLAERRAVDERDLKEQARAEAVANEARARAAEAAGRLELGKTAAAAAELAAGHGHWEEALRLYETALEFSGGDEIELKLGHYGCRQALGQVREAMAELDELAARPDLGRFAGLVLLCKAESAVWRQSGGNPRELARAALEKGLPAADAAYARAFLVRSAPEAIRLLQEASHQDPFHFRGLEWLSMLLFITGHRDEFREVVAQLRLCRPNSAGFLVSEMLLRALDGDRPGAEALLARLDKMIKELRPLLQAFLDLISLSQNEDFFFEGLPARQRDKFLAEMAKMARHFSRMAGEKNADNAGLTNLRYFQLPMFHALAETPTIKGLAAGGPLGALALLGQPSKIADVFGAVVEALPDGTFYLLHGVFLHQAGRLVEAETALRHSLENPSWANHRRAARFHLLQVQWELANSPRISAPEQAVWKERARENLRELALSSSRPLPPGPISFLTQVAPACGETALGLSLTEAALRKEPKDLDLLGSKLKLELGLGAGDRAEGTARAIQAVVEAGSKLNTAGWTALVNTAHTYRDAGRTTDAVRWCNWLQQRLTGLGPDDPELLETWNNLGVAYWRLKQLDQSIPIFERVLAAERKVRGEQHLETLRAQINLGVNYRDAGRLEEAVPLLEEADREGGASPSLRWVRFELLTAYIAAGKSAEGIRLTKELLAEARKEHPPGSTTLASVLAQRGSDFLQLKAWSEAEPILREALVIREKSQPDDWTKFNSRSMLGEALAGQKKYADAEPLLVQGFEGMKQRAAQMATTFRAERLTAAAARLVRLYETLQKNDQAEKWRKELEAVKKQ
jgi:tetratricopeptide (TPR) repeat protein